VLAAHPHVSRYLHLPFQAGANEILDRMHRRYTREEYLELVVMLREAVPEINLSTDVIVGFPGETEEHFEQTLDLLREIRFGQVFAFAFSPRPRTPAARYEGQVVEAAKKDRLHRLFALTDEISTELNRALVGTDVAVLIDGDSRRNPDHWQGRGDDNRVVNFAKSGREEIGDIVDVRITRAGAHSLFGERCSGDGRLPVVGAA
jgi:tRNA-2-methylthio-N6-dimethylallyladenosine synthase